MLSLADFEPWWRFGFSLLIGALIGLEREFHQQKEDNPDFAGIRTFSLIAILGSVTSFLLDDFGIIPTAIGLGGLILLTTRLLEQSHARLKQQAVLDTLTSIPNRRFFIENLVDEFRRRIGIAFGLGQAARAHDGIEREADIV